MQSWDLLELELLGGTRSPIVLHSTDDARAVLIGLEPGQQLGDHQVHENAWMVVVDGSVQVSSGDEQVDAAAGTLFRFEEKERHRVSSADGGRILLLLAPWPGAGHYRGDPTRGAG